MKMDEEWFILPSRKGEVAHCKISDKLKFRGSNWHSNSDNTLLYLSKEDIIFAAKLAELNNS